MSDDQKKLQTSDDLALDALSEASQGTPALAAKSEDQEVAESNQLAETLSSLQGVIERNAQHLEAISGEMKLKREEMKNVLDNDAQLSEAQNEAKETSSKVKERRAVLQADPQITSLKVQVGELSQQKKEIEETLSNHLVNYYSLTNSKSFDTTDGDQWEFSVRAKVKSRKK
jgi:small-conductance mechanosensitive channel